MKNYLFFSCLYLFLVVGCLRNDTGIVIEKEEEQTAYPDDVYCAEVDYYNPVTNTTNNYTLKVEVEDNHVVKILFGNGGWLDNSHMRPPELDENGECKVESYDGPEYSIQIMDMPCVNYDVLVPASTANLTMEQCATVLNMSEEELQDYEQRFRANRRELMSDEMCEKFTKYITGMRKLQSQMQALEDDISEGYIQWISIRSSGEVVYCHNLIVKKYGKYYWMEVGNTQKCTMGLMKFDHSSTVWQEVVVQQDPARPEVNIYRMRVVEEADNKEYLESRINSLCAD